MNLLYIVILYRILIFYTCSNLKTSKYIAERFKIKVCFLEHLSIYSALIYTVNNYIVIKNEKTFLK